jgi:hypothetical protein
LGKLIAGGDSFTYGSELQDCYRLADPEKGIPEPYEVVSNLTYSALIAKELNLQYICVAWPGYSNSSIRRTVMNICEKEQDIEQVIVMWSFSGRYEFKIRDNWEQLSPWSVEDDIEKKIKKEFVEDNPAVFHRHVEHIARERELGITEFAKVFYNQIGSYEYWEVYNSLLDIVMLQQFLENKHIPYLFTGVDECIIKSITNHIDVTIQTLNNQVNRSKWFWFPNNRGFYTWAKEEKFPFATTHPKEPAHIEAAHLIYEHLRYIGRLP